MLSQNTSFLICGLSCSIGQSMKSVSIIIPAINEEEGIEKTISAIPRQKLKEMGYSVEIIVIDGGSKDRTAELATRAGAKIIVELRKGYGLALKTGFNAAVGDIIASADADHTYPVEDIPELLAFMEKNKLEFLNTDRFKMMDEDAMKLRNKIGNIVLSLAARILFGLPFNDSQSGMWFMRKYVWDAIRERTKSDGMAFSEEIKIEAFRAGFKCEEIGIKYHKRKGKAKLNAWRDGLGNMLHLLKKRLWFL